LRALARSNQKTIYNLLFRASSAALLQLAQDPRFVGARLGMVGVLHTWTRQLLYHPHVHYIVTGGGLTDDGRWRSSRKDFLVPVKALSECSAPSFVMIEKDPALRSPRAARLAQRLVVHSEPVGSGAQAFQYLAPYIFRVAISNNRIRKLENGRVTFAYKESATDQLRHCTLDAQEFIRRFLQHVSPTLHQNPLLRSAQPRPASTATESQTTALSFHQQTKECRPKADPAAANLSQCRAPLTLLGPSLPEARAMKLPLRLFSSSYCLRWRSPLHRLRPTLSAATKKQPHWLARSTSRSASFASPLLLLHAARTSHTPPPFS